MLISYKKIKKMPDKRKKSVIFERNTYKTSTIVKTVLKAIVLHQITFKYF